MIDRKGRLYAVGDGEGSMSSPEMEIDYYYSKRGTAGSHYAARLLRRAAAVSSLKAPLAADVAVTNSEFDWKRKFLNTFK